MGLNKISPEGNLLIQIAIQFINLPVDQLDNSIVVAMKTLGEYLGSDRFYVFAYNWQVGTGSNTHEWCSQGIEPQIHTLQNIPLDSFSEWIEWHKHGKIHVIEDVALLPENTKLRSMLESQSILSLIAAPIMYG